MKKIIAMYLLFVLTVGLSAMDNEKASRATQRLKKMLWEEGGGNFGTLFLMGKKEEIKKLINDGADIYTKGGGGNVFNYAAWTYDCDFLIFLVRRGANPNYQDGSLSTALMCAASSDKNCPLDVKKKAIDILLDAGADRTISMKNIRNSTAACWAEEHNQHPDVINMLKEEQKRKIF